MNIVDASYKKSIAYHFRGHNLNFKVSQMLFGSQQIDIGTHHLLRSFETERVDKYKKVLDLGSGYGPLGISLKKFLLSSEVHMVDRDSLAVDYCKENSVLNDLRDLKTYGSLGYDDVVDTDFDLIVSNIPAKVGDRALTYILEEAEFYLRPGGRVMVVVIDAIVDLVTQVLTTNENIHILFQKKWPGYTVFHYGFTRRLEKISKPKQTAFERRIFDRDDMKFLVGDTEVKMLTTHSLSEFDTLQFDTQLLLDKLSVIHGKSFKDILVFNPGQGHLPVAATIEAHVGRATLVDRNLQALRTSKRNLLKNGYRDEAVVLYHQSDLSLVSEMKFECILGILEEKDISEVHALLINQAITNLTDGGIIVLGSSSTVISRLEKVIHKTKGVQIQKRERVKGNSVIILRHKENLDSS